MNSTTSDVHYPQILSPAGDRHSFLAALAAGADAIYCGLKSFSARMEAKNFTVEELASLTTLAHQKNTSVYLTLNSLIKQSELPGLKKWLKDAVKKIKPDALIIQDLSFISLARSIQFKGEIHLSTLSNISFSRALQYIKRNFPINAVVLPRELSIDEIKIMAEKCPQNLHLEVFIHGALCYGVSGRCYWSSFLGGKSGLRGRCVQPCRRLYNYKDNKKRFFSCNDFCLDVLVKTLKSVPEIRTWKIEGRKKGPHYVYHTTMAYKLLRDNPNNRDIKKQALNLLEYSLSRNITHYHFLPQRKFHPISTENDTGSGYLIGRISGKKSKRFFSTREPLFPGDKLRIGYEDQPGHHVQIIKRSIPKNGQWVIQNTKLPVVGAPVFLIDRKDPYLMEKIDDLEKELKISQNEISSVFKPDEYKNSKYQKNSELKPYTDLTVYRNVEKFNNKNQTALWLSLKNVERISKKFISNVWWWLPPVIWPENENSWYDLISKVINMGAHKFVLNAPWQRSFFNNQNKFQFWAGPYCNISNRLEIDILKEQNFKGVIISPELEKADILSLPSHSSLPLGIITSGLWPLTISRIPPDEMKPYQEFISPKGEMSWYTCYEDQLNWVFPNWFLDMTKYKNILIKSGYTFFVHLKEPVPKKLEIKDRPGIWNWNMNI